LQSADLFPGRARRRRILAEDPEKTGEFSRLPGIVGQPREPSEESGAVAGSRDESGLTE
jgi:hypothetical protein